MAQDSMHTIDQMRREEERVGAEQAKEYRQQVEDMREMLSTKSGRNVLWVILGLTEYTDYFNDSESLEKQSGKREVGLDLLQYIERADQEAYPKMIIENLEPIKK